MNKNWKPIALGLSASIFDALKVINEQPYKIILITDENDYLIGTVTDGDIRRGLLKGLWIDESIGSVMNSSPITATITDDKIKVIAILKQKSISSVPVVENGRLIGFYSIESLLQRSQYDNPVFIMAGGFGTRLRPLTDTCPKPMLKVGDKPILEITLQRFIDAGFRNFYISTHYLPEVIRDYFADGAKWNVKIEYVHEDSPLGTGGALGLLPKTVEQLPLIMINGDVLTNLDIAALLDYHNTNEALATMCVREFDYQIPYGVVEKNGNQIVRMTEKPKYQFQVNAGIYVVSPKLFNTVELNKKIDMPSLLEDKIKNSERVVVYPLKEYWLDIGQMNEYKQAQKDIISMGL